ncbi:MAG TPA: sodium-translocating pyrophosphatase, partial [Smithella sp.]|nr:sodium-translocating pyrophosphatase [Smithella sp.]
MLQNKRSIWTFLLSSLMFLLMAGAAFAGEADINLPDLTQVSFMGGTLAGLTILNAGLIICIIGMAFGIMQYVQTKNLPAHKAMLDVSQTIWETC